MRDAREALLGGLTPAAFMRRHWHKRPQVVRGALPGFEGPFRRDDLFALARRDDVESRLVVREGRRWTLTHGPFRKRDLAGLPPRNWTLLVQGANLHDERADRLLRRFAFIPFARLDDLMVSYAAPGGGVGPHFDSYDVFLLQGFGRRRWRYGAQSDLSLVPRHPLRILARFMPSHEAIVGPGDLVYLPPHVAHDGVALEACTTYSIGFRAPAAQELATAFLDFLRDRVALEGRYADPDLVATREPARVGSQMQNRAASMLARLRWGRAELDRFLGCWLSEPKPSVVFDPPAHPPAPAAWRRLAATSGVKLDRRTQLLYDDQALFINGEAHAWPRSGGERLRELANERRLSASACASLSQGALALIGEWYRHGYLGLDA